MKECLSLNFTSTCTSVYPSRIHVTSRNQNGANVAYYWPFFPLRLGTEGASWFRRSRAPRPPSAKHQEPSARQLDIDHRALHLLLPYDTVAASCRLSLACVRTCKEE